MAALVAATFEANRSPSRRPPAPSEGRAGAGWRRRARRRAHRRARSPRGAARSVRLHRGHEHGRADERRVSRGRLARARCARRSRPPTGRACSTTRPGARRSASATRSYDDRFFSALEFGVTRAGSSYREGAVAGTKIKLFFNELVRADAGQLMIEDLPAAAHADGHRHRHRRARRDAQRRPHDGDAREHVGARSRGAGAARGTQARRRRARGQRARSRRCATAAAPRS